MLQSEFLRALPKIELHAHLNGSVRDATLRALLAERGVADVDDARRAMMLESINAPSRTLSDCFVIFDAIHRVTTTAAATERIASEAVQDFAAQQCVYLELRTTPKCTADLSKRDYVRAVLRGIALGLAATAGDDDAIDVGLLLSINRATDSAADARECVELAREFRDAGACVYGVELSGNPAKGDVSLFADAMAEAHRLALGVSIHIGEVADRDAELLALLDMRPHRLGHAVFLSEAARALVLARRIPIEICLTSNVLTDSVASYGEHHMREYAQLGHPIVLCTDDCGVFATTLTREYELAAAHLGVGAAQFCELARAAPQCIIGAPESVRERVRARVERRLAAIDVPR